MNIASVRIDGGQPVELTMREFTSIRLAHAHLFKHVVRICDVSRFDAAGRDPEDWASLIPSPPLESSLLKRREQARRTLSQVDGCALGQLGETQLAPCLRCDDRSAKVNVQQQNAPLLDAYIAVAAETLRWSVKNSGPRGARVIAYRPASGRGVRFIAERPDGVRAVADLAAGGAELKLVSCYRVGKDMDYRSRWMEMCREQSGFRQQGLAVDVQPAAGGAHG